MIWVLAPVVALLALHLLVARMEVRALYGLCDSYKRLHESDKNLQQANDTLIAEMRTYIDVIEKNNVRLRIAAEQHAAMASN